MDKRDWAKIDFDKFMSLKTEKTEEDYLTFLEDTGIALEFVPDEMKTEKVCLEAIVNDPAAFEFIPKRLKTKEFYETIIYELVERDY